MCRFDITVDGSKAETAPSASKKRKDIGVTEIPSVIIKANTASDQSYIRFEKLSPSIKIVAELNEFINDIPIASLMNPMIAQLLICNITVYSSFRIII